MPRALHLRARVVRFMQRTPRGRALLDAIERELVRARIACVLAEQASAHADRSQAEEDPD